MSTRRRRNIAKRLDPDLFYLVATKRSVEKSHLTERLVVDLVLRHRFKARCIGDAIRGQPTYCIDAPEGFRFVVATTDKVSPCGTKRMGYVIDCVDLRD